MANGEPRLYQLQPFTGRDVDDPLGAPYGATLDERVVTAG